MHKGIQLRPATADDRPAIRALLLEAALPVDDLDTVAIDFVVASRGDALVGAAGMERLAPDTVLLRSFAVAATLRKQGVGSALLARLIMDARRTRVRDLYLLTLSADRFFERHGFCALPREAAPDAVRRHPQFTGLCPASAVLMHFSGDPA